MNSVILQFHHSAWVISCTRTAKTYLATTLHVSYCLTDRCGRAGAAPPGRPGPDTTTPSRALGCRYHRKWRSVDLGRLGYI